jgi:fermentation-respiration switch protein FrsA (DUF1100 family)
VVKAWVAGFAAALVLLVGDATGSAFAKQDVLIPMDDGVSIAATLSTPEGAPPAAGWPAIVFMHGLAQNRQIAEAIAEGYGFVGQSYAVLTFDARGHGESGGLIGIDGPREIADVKAIFAWLAARPDVADSKIGAWGISYGGGAALNSLAAGVPWAAVEVAETWTDLYSALVPNGLPKSGVIGVFLASLPQAKLDPSVLAVREAAFTGTNPGLLRSWATARSSLSRLRGKRTPVFFMQGRRDFAFGLDQATRAYALLAGPKRLWIGNHGHAPSTFPAADTTKMLADGKRWFDRFLRGVQNGIDKQPPVVVAVEGKAVTRSYAGPPRAREAEPLVFLRRSVRITPAQKWSVSAGAAPGEIYGSPGVGVTATATGGWSRLVAVLSARTPDGREIVVSAGGVPTRPGKRTYAIGMIDQATVIPRGSRLVLTLADSSLAQNPANLLYLKLPTPAGARLTVNRVALTYGYLRG